MNETNQRLIAAHSTFAKVQPAGWSLASGHLSQGAQSSVCLVTNSDGIQGVFRCLADPTTTAIKRFKREIEVLSSIQHPNVMRLLDSSIEHDYWYISRRGTDLREFWKNCQSAELDVNALLPEAIALILQLCDGLAVCHEKGIVHRDIKPANIVVHHDSNKFVPVLIDFGVAWQGDSERLTELDRPVSNVGFSPDVMRNRLEEYVPWVDVFELVQVMQWLIAEKSTKSWNRPVHWRYVSYPDALDMQQVTLLRALAAAVSIESASPADARELAALIQNLFSTPITPANRTAVDFGKIEAARAQGRATTILRSTMTQEEIEASRPIAQLRYAMFETVMREMADAPRIVLTELAQQSTIFHASAAPNTDVVALRLEMQSSPPGFFKVELFVHKFVSTRWPPGNKRPDWLAGSNHFAFSLEVSGQAAHVYEPFPNFGLKFTIESDARIYLRGAGWDNIERPIDEQWLRSTLLETIGDTERWRLITS